MKKSTRKQQPIKTRPPERKPLFPTYPTELTDRQSVRTTFRLSKAGSGALKSLAKHHGVTLKDVFDNLCGRILADKYAQDIQDASSPPKDSFLYKVARAAKGADAKTTDHSVRKTQVISRGALKVLKDVSKECQIPRDLLVDWSLIAIRQLTKEATRKREKSYKKALKVISDFRSKAYSVEDNLTDVVEPDDTIVARFGRVLTIIENLCSAIESNLEKGTPIDPDDISQTG